MKRERSGDILFDHLRDKRLAIVADNAQLNPLPKFNAEKSIEQLEKVLKENADKGRCSITVCDVRMFKGGSYSERLATFWNDDWTRFHDWINHSASIVRAASTKKARKKLARQFIKMYEDFITNFMSAWEKKHPMLLNKGNAVQWEFVWDSE